MSVIGCPGGNRVRSLRTFLLFAAVGLLLLGPAFRDDVLSDWLGLVGGIALAVTSVWHLRAARDRQWTGPRLRPGRVKRIAIDVLTTLNERALAAQET